MEQLTENLKHYAFLFVILSAFLGGWYLIADTYVTSQETLAAYKLLGNHAKE